MSVSQLLVLLPSCSSQSIESCAELCKMMGEEDSIVNDFWSAQREATSLPAVGFATTTDIQRATHPPDKQDVATRLALELRRVAYGEAVVSRGPELISVAKINSTSVVLRFSNSSLSSHAGILVGNESTCGNSTDGLASNPVNKRPLAWSISDDLLTVQCAEPNGLVRINADYTGCFLYGPHGLPAPPLLFACNGTDFSRRE
jgi:hypothetical protein